MHKIIYHKRGHLGDCVHTMHYIKKLLLYYNDLIIDFYIKPEYMIEISFLIETQYIDRLFIFDINKYQDSLNGVNAWYGELGSELNVLINSMSHDEFFIKWFDKVSQKLEVVNPFQKLEDFIMDNENILIFNKMDKNFDFLIINSDTLSGQVKSDEKSFGEMIDYLAKKYTIITTKKYKNYPCTRDNNLTLLDIANISLKCKNIISVATSPLILCLNKWSIKTCNEFILICNLFDFRYNLGYKEKFTTTRSIEECKQYILKKF
jgi:hypothetical protein